MGLNPGTKFISTRTIDDYRFSSLVTSLTSMWLNWMKQNKIAMDGSLSQEERERASTRCEELITEEYKLVSELDKYFE